MPDLLWSHWMYLIYQILPFMQNIKNNNIISLFKRCFSETRRPQLWNALVPKMLHDMPFHTFKLKIKCLEYIDVLSECYTECERIMISHILKGWFPLLHIWHRNGIGTRSETTWACADHYFAVLWDGDPVLFRSQPKLNWVQLFSLIRRIQLDRIFLNQSNCRVSYAFVFSCKHFNFDWRWHANK